MSNLDLVNFKKFNSSDKKDGRIKHMMAIIVEKSLEFKEKLEEGEIVLEDPNIEIYYCNPKYKITAGDLERCKYYHTNSESAIADIKEIKSMDNSIVAVQYEGFRFKDKDGELVSLEDMANKQEKKMKEKKMKEKKIKEEPEQLVPAE